MLTKKQLMLLEFIEQKVSSKGISPSFDEMKDALNLKSKSGIHRLIIALEERGFIRRLPHRARALEVIKKVQRSPSEVVALDRKRFQMRPENNNKIHASSTLIPHLGKIAAGTPIEAISDLTNQISVPPTMMGVGQHFALEVKGESMIEAGINNGDIVVIKEQSEANNGDIVVALIEDQEATLKKIYKKGNFIELKAANQNFETQIYDTNKITIQGKLVGLLRKY